jgi:hypothetical protein
MLKAITKSAAGPTEEAVIISHRALVAIIRRPPSWVQIFAKRMMSQNHSETSHGDAQNKNMRTPREHSNPVAEKDLYVLG